jgi:putative hydrolase of the HAD superfamily
LNFYYRWVRTVKSALENCGRTKYSQEEFDRFFRRIYQHYGSLDGYEKLSDALPFLDWLQEQNGKYSLGVTTNTPVRTVETVLPMNGFHEYFQWFVCSQDIGIEKPEKGIFDDAYKRALFWTPDLKREEILHIGDSMAADFCGARAAGFQALYLDRSENPRVTVYQDWLEAPAYPGKSEEDIANGTIKDLQAIIPLLEESAKNFG